ncbi:hypothetical protein [Sphingosinicella microcystinivorans]|uniref:Uncharacterized protein n=1 Tax=Sphingosinicella microcystinivorans TaxID=335406 RepID=A0AAD1G1X2_SPHMI|nr:hypothetical protein [Sphingosinicella microcystinivorans]RKS94302.1 hypothetical protein DFR51_0008 [Sphingosinicella microcystinivorans]BBE35278.1 hypothetical protein SmB9_29360 [Sphingosinicella microcystinivorans]
MTSEIIEYRPAVFQAESHIQTDMDTAWRKLLDYEAWNPTFAGATVTRVEGEPQAEGESVRITKTYHDPKSPPFPPFYADTVKLIPGRRVVWYCYPERGEEYHAQADAFRNFVDFSLSEDGVGVRFNINYFAQFRLTGAALSQELGVFQNGLHELASAFRDFCERETA